MYQEAASSEPIQSVPDGERPLPGDATIDKPVPVEAPPVHPNAEVRPLEAGKQALVPEEPTAGPMQVDSSAAVAAPSREAATSGQKPNLQIQAPTPVVQQDEDEMIQDRTPEQAARDNDIEMSDSGPSLPLTEQDAAVVVEEEKQAHERRESSSQQDLPPPPPPRQEQHDGTAVSHDTSMVSTPEPDQKWLLPPIRQELRGRKCLVLDLDETLVHSSFKVK
jgi:RNA polymerase II subunit A small phosphatase-like protein